MENTNSPSSPFRASSRRRSHHRSRRPAKDPATLTLRRASSRWSSVSVKYQTGSPRAMAFRLEAAPGFEPGDNGFEIRCLTPWLRGRGGGGPSRPAAGPPGHGGGGGPRPPAPYRGRGMSLKRKGTSRFSTFVRPLTVAFTGLPLSSKS